MLANYKKNIVPLLPISPNKDKLWATTLLKCWTTPLLTGSFQITSHYKINNNFLFIMAITNVITNTVKDVFALSQNIAKVVKEEIDLKLKGGKDDEDDIDYDYDSSSKESSSSSLSSYFEGFEVKAKELVHTAFSGFQSSKSEEQAELEERIAALEAKLSKLVEESLETIRNNK